MAQAGQAHVKPVARAPTGRDDGWRAGCGEVASLACVCTRTLRTKTLANRSRGGGRADPAGRPAGEREHRRMARELYDGWAAADAVMVKHLLAARDLTWHANPRRASGGRHCASPARVSL